MKHLQDLKPHNPAFWPFDFWGRRLLYLWWSLEASNVILRSDSSSSRRLLFWQLAIKLNGQICIISAWSFLLPTFGKPSISDKCVFHRYLGEIFVLQTFPIAYVKTMRFNCANKSIPLKRSSSGLKTLDGPFHWKIRRFLCVGSRLLSYMQPNLMASVFLKYCKCHTKGATICLKYSFSHVRFTVIGPLSKKDI